MRYRRSVATVQLFAIVGLMLPRLLYTVTPEKIVILGKTLSIPCSLDTPGSSIQWLLNGEPVVLDVRTSQRRHWNISRTGATSLTITGVTKADNGVWECRELGIDGSVHRVAEVLRLVVAIPPEDPFLVMEGRRLAHQATITVREPTRITVQCVARGAVPPVRHIYWLLGDTNVTSISELFVEFTPGDDAYISRSVIALNVTRKLHRKELICHVHHVTWLESAAVSASLIVLYVPSFSITREPGFGFPILEGMAVSLKCDVDANPASSPKWIKDDGPLAVEPSPDGYLNFTSINRSHAGWYRCATEHQLGTFASFGYYLNVRHGGQFVRQPAPEVEAGLGEPIKMECIAEGRPEITAYNKSLMAIAGRSTSLAVQFCANPRPIRVHWILRHLVLSPGDKYLPYIAHNITESDSSHCYRTWLEITQVNPENAGEILFLVKNIRGIHDALFLLNVTQASFSVSKGASLSTLLFPFVLLSCLFHSAISYMPGDGS